MAHSASSATSSLPETPSLLSVLKALPADCVRSNLVSAFGRLSDADSSSARPPIGGHQWLPGQWTPVLYGLSHDWRAYARSVLTHSLTIDLAITVSLQRPSAGACSSAFEILESFLAGFPSLQRLTILAGNGGAPVDDSARPVPASVTNGGSSTLLAMAEAVSVALAAQQLLRLDRNDPGAASQWPRLTSLELRLHPAVWRALRGSGPHEFLQRLVSAHPGLEELSLHVAKPVPMGPGTASTPSSPPGTTSTTVGDGQVVVVGVAALAALPGLVRLRLAGPIVVPGLSELTQLQSLALEGVLPSGVHDSTIGALSALTSLHLSDSHHRPTPIPAGAAAGREQGPSTLALPQLRGNPLLASRLRSLRLPDVVVGPKDLPVLARLCPNLEELELASVTPPPTAAAAAATAKDAASRSGADARSGVWAGSGAAGSSSGVGIVPDWFLRATVGDEAAYSNGSGRAGSGGSGSAGASGIRWPNRQPSGGVASSKQAAGVNREQASGERATGGGGGGCPFAAMAGGGGGSKRAPLIARGAGSATSEAVVLPGLKRLVLWEYIPPWQMVELVQMIPDLKEMRASLLLDDPPDLPAAALRPAAVATLRPLVEALRSVRDVRLTVSCDPAAVTGQLACVFLMECGMAAVDGIQGLSLTVWVAAETQLGSLVALRQLRSLELTLGKQEQESELSVLTRLERLSYLSLRIIPGIWNEIQGRTGRVTAGAALRLAMSFAAGQVLLLVADVHREICEDEAISLVKSVEMTTGQPGAAWAVSAWVEETAECIMGYGLSAGGSATLGGGGGGGGDGRGVLRVVWTPELVRRLLGVVAGAEGRASGGLAVSFMGAEEERLGRVLGS